MAKNMTQHQAREQVASAALTALVDVPGVLKIIANWCACGSEAPHALSACAACKKCTRLAEQKDEHDRPLDNRNPGHFHQLDVVRIEQRNNDMLRVYAEDGSWCQGYASDLLRRLQEWRA